MSESQSQPERLQKVIARKGIASRRQAEDLIRRGLVKVNGVVVTEQGVRVEQTDLIEVQGVQAPVKPQVDCLYILLHKPEGVISSVRDPKNRRTVTDILQKEIKERLYPVGRLDYDTSGLLLMTNDGELTYRLTHPRFGVEKTYRVWIRKPLTREALELLERGVLLEDGLTSPAKICTFENELKGNNDTVVEITIHEGKNRQVRRMFEKVGFPICKLKRTRFGPLLLEDQIKPGTYRSLTGREVLALKKEVGLLGQAREDGEDA